MWPGIFRWLYRLMGIALLLSGFAILAVGLLEKNFVCALLSVVYARTAWAVRRR